MENTNYHYIIEDDIHLSESKTFDEFLEAKSLDIQTKPVLTGAFTLLKLAKYTGYQNASCFNTNSK